MHSILLHGRRPICGNTPLERLPIGYRLVVEKLDQAQAVGGVRAFQCSEEWYIFFVAAKDVEASRPPNRLLSVVEADVGSSSPIRCCANAKRVVSETYGAEVPATLARMTAA